MIFISEYEVDREYGGPEEGGWWFDNHQHIRVVAITDNEDDATYICQALNAKWREEKDSPDRYSMACTEPDISYLSEEEIGSHTTHERPHYE